MMKQKLTDKHLDEITLRVLQGLRGSEKNQLFEILRETQEKKMNQSWKDFHSGILLSSEEVMKIISDTIRETLPMPQSEKDRRKKIRQRDTERREKEYEKGLDKIRAMEHDDSDDPLTDEDEYPLLAKPKDEAKKQKKKNCSNFGKGKKSGANAFHHPTTGEFTDRKTAGSWSLKNCEDPSSDVKKGQAKMKGGKELFTKVKCGRDEKYRCRDGKEK